MKKYLSLLVALVVTLFAASSFAFTPPPAPQNGWYVSDQAGKLSPDQINTLNQKIERVSKATKNEFGILLLQDMGGDNIEDVASATFKAWGIGKRGLDNGCLIVVAIKERKSRIETGKGVEGEVTDLQANDILKKNLNPHLKQGDFAGGFNDTVDALGSLIESRHNQKATPAPTTRSSSGCSVNAAGADTSDSGSGFIWVLFAVGAIGLVAVLFARASARRRREEAEKLRREMERERRLAESRRREAEAQRARDAARLERERKAAEESLNIPTPVVPVPAITRPSSRPTVPRPTPRASVPPPTRKETPTAKQVVSAAAIGAGAVTAAAALAQQQDAAERLRRKREEDRQDEERRAEARRREREREEEDRRRRERDEEDRRRRQREEDDRRSSSSSSSYDWGSSSSGGGGFDSGGGGFGGGDSGGGGSSSDW